MPLSSEELLENQSKSYIPSLKHVHVEKSETRRSDEARRLGHGANVEGWWNVDSFDLS